MDMEGAQEPQGDPERSPSPTMPLTPTRRSHQFLLTSSPTPEEASEWDEEGGMPPRQPRLAWQETWSSEGSNRPAEDSLLEEGYIADEDSILSEDSEGSLDDLLDVERSLPEDTALSEPTNTAQLLEDAGKAWKLCKYSAVEFIRAYVRGTEKDDEEQKMLFLSKICDLCRCVTKKGVPLNLHGFCSKHKLVENIMAPLSLFFSKTVPTALCGEKERLLNICFKSIFFLPPKSDMPETEGALYTKWRYIHETRSFGYTLSLPHNLRGNKRKLTDKGHEKLWAAPHDIEGFKTSIFYTINSV
ncbi:uncharacterized protein [Anas platyrhynchos]|uniref:uncharacterized protein n=1 Tax=Anas platyrhynchos TaxID=8839 RepID=UPI003AF22EFE